MFLAVQNLKLSQTFRVTVCHGCGCIHIKLNTSCIVGPELNWFPHQRKHILCTLSKSLGSYLFLESSNDQCIHFVTEILSISFEIRDFRKNQNLYIVKFHVFAWYAYIQCQVCSARIALFHLLVFHEVSRKNSLTEFNNKIATAVTQCFGQRPIHMSVLFLQHLSTYTLVHIKIYVFQVIILECSLTC